MLVPTIVMVLGVVISSYKSPIYRAQYIMPALGVLAMFFGLALRKSKKIVLIIISLFLLFVGAMQYKECRYQEYYSTLYPQTKEYFDENLYPEDYIIYNYKMFGFIYECHFPEEQLVYLEDFDFTQYHSGNIYFLDTMWEPEIDPVVLEQNGYVMELVGHYGIEHNEFDLYVIYRK